MRVKERMDVCIGDGDIVRITAIVRMMISGEGESKGWRSCEK